uniref:Taste receptor type 2 n=1 Tax=Cavia porcellus TaxID=10141 RepID=H0UXB8_CAVPO
MLTYQFVTHFLVVVTQFFPGVLANGFIVVVNMVDFFKQRQMAPLDLLLSCLATSRIILQVLIFLAHLSLVYFLKPSVLAKTSIIFMFVNVWGLWLATWLGVFYCAKIATIPHPLFFWLKRRISKSVPWLILGCLLYASICAGMNEKQRWSITQNILANFLSRNATETKRLDIVSFSVLIFHVIVPLIIFLIAVLILIFSLWRHTQHRRTMATGGSGPHRGASFRALLSILSFLFLYVSHYMMVIVLFFQMVQFDSFLFEFCTFIAGTYPSIHSVILILGHPKLKQKAKKFLLCTHCGHLSILSHGYSFSIVTKDDADL